MKYEPCVLFSCGYEFLEEEDEELEGFGFTGLLLDAANPVFDLLQLSIQLPYKRNSLTWSFRAPISNTVEAVSRTLVGKNQYHLDGTMP